MWSKREPFHALLPLLRQVVPLNDGNCHLTIPVVKGRYASEALPHAFNIGVLKYGKRIFTRQQNFTENNAFGIKIKYLASVPMTQSFYYLFNDNTKIDTTHIYPYHIVMI